MTSFMSRRGRLSVYNWSIGRGMFNFNGGFGSSDDFDIHRVKIMRVFRCTRFR